MRNLEYIDSLYGPVSLEADLTSLAFAPVMQRLRHIRLSNIDSLDMPGIANLSRYEHVLGVGYLATSTQLYKSLTRIDQLSLAAAALLHDWAISAFGHLVEEAFQYTGTFFDHEERLHELLEIGDPTEIGGAEKQILYGRQTKLNVWAERAVGFNRVDELICRITNLIRGEGTLGRLICGDIDLDNIDNIYRMAFHMGMSIDRQCPLRLARAVIATDDETRAPIFRLSVRNDLREWILLRRRVYERLMLADKDFVGKLMLLYASIAAIQEGEIEKTDWSITDVQLLERLLCSQVSRVKDTVTRWLTGELWHKTPLFWMEGERPGFSAMRTFSEELSHTLTRNCLVYAIKDKRHRIVVAHFENGEREELGKQAEQWLIGAGAAERRPFSVAEIQTFKALAESHFKSTVVAKAAKLPGLLSLRDDEACLL